MYVYVCMLRALVYFSELRTRFLTDDTDVAQSYVYEKETRF